MIEDDAYDNLGRLAFGTAGKLRLAAELMTALSIQPDGYPPPEIVKLADALQGMSMRCAMHTGNTALLGELSGRPVTAVTAPLAADSERRRDEEFTDELLRRCTEVTQQHDGCVPDTWEAFWRLATAFVAHDHDTLTEMGLTTVDVAHAVAGALSADFQHVVSLLDIASRKIDPGARNRYNAPVSVTIAVRVEIEIDKTRWSQVVDNDAPGTADRTLQDIVTDLVKMMLPGSPRLVLSWAEVIVHPTESTSAPTSPAHDVITMRIEVTVPDQVWRETRPTTASLAEDVRAYVADQIGGIAQFDDTGARVTTTLHS